MRNVPVKVVVILGVLWNRLVTIDIHPLISTKYKLPTNSNLVDLSNTSKGILMNNNFQFQVHDLVSSVPLKSNCEAPRAAGVLFTLDKNI